MPKRALLSVSDKTGLLPLAEALRDAGYEILSTGGTTKALKDGGIAVLTVESVTEFPECFGGRVKTMHPKIMGGILFRRDDPAQMEEAKRLGIEPIDVVIVNLYPFEKVADDPKASDEMRIEQIDIGGPTLLRSAAKNAAHVTVLCDPADYQRVIAELQAKKETSPKLRRELAEKVFARIAAYDALIAATLSEGQCGGMILSGGTTLRYGENPHQSGMYYDPWGQPRTWSVVQEEPGKPVSYLNLLDADAAWNLVCEFDEPTAACIKHANPSGVASNETITDAFQSAYDTDKLSAFGVIVALNRECPVEIIQKIVDQKIFVEVIIAPEYEKEAVNLLKNKPKIRVLQKNQKPETRNQKLYRSALGGLLVQTTDDRIVTEKDLTVVTKKKPTEEQVRDLLFAWKVVKHAKSNAIVFAKDRVTVGIGCGQTSRVDSTWIAAKRAGERAKGAMMASDAFFPFPDSIEEAAKHGIAAIIQPGGSVRDAEVFAKADELGLAMVVTGVRAFRH